MNMLGSNLCYDLFSQDRLASLARLGYWAKGPRSRQCRYVFKYVCCILKKKICVWLPCIRRSEFRDLWFVMCVDVVNSQSITSFLTSENQNIAQWLKFHEDQRSNTSWTRRLDFCMLTESFIPRWFTPTTMGSFRAPTARTTILWISLCWCKNQWFLSLFCAPSLSELCEWWTKVNKTTK